MSKAFIITSFIENEIDINSRVNSEIMLFARTEAMILQRFREFGQI